MNVNLKIFAFFVILCATSKASENLCFENFVLKQSLILSNVFAVIIICCPAGAVHEDQRLIALDLFQNCDVPGKVSGTVDPRGRFK